MANIQISALPNLTTTSDTDLLHIRSGAVDYKTTRATLLDGLDNDELKGSLTSTGSNSAYILTTGDNYSSLSIPMAWVFKSNHTCTGTCTLQVDSAGAVGLKTLEGLDFIAGDIDNGGMYFAVYDGTNFICANAPWSASATRKGVVELATTAEADTGTDTERAVTPEGLLSSILANAPSPVDASSIAKGIIEIATDTETQAGVVSTLAVSPKSLASLTASETRAGLTETATQTEINTGVDDERYATALKLKNWERDATEAVKGFVERATQAEVDAQSDTTKYVTPAHLGTLSVTGSVVMMASTVVPVGHLECNGGEYSRTTYAGLYAAIGNTWGVGDGSTTFNVPDMRGESIRGWDNGRGIDSGRVIGVHQAGQSNHLRNTNEAGGSPSTTGPDIPSDGSYSGWVANGGSGAGSKMRYRTYGRETLTRNQAFMFCIRT